MLNDVKKIILLPLLIAFSLVYGQDKYEKGVVIFYYTFRTTNRAYTLDSIRLFTNETAYPVLAETTQQEQFPIDSINDNYPTPQFLEQLRLLPEYSNSTYPMDDNIHEGGDYYVQGDSNRRAVIAFNVTVLTLKVQPDSIAFSKKKAAILAQQTAIYEYDREEETQIVKWENYKSVNGNEYVVFKYIKKASSLSRRQMKKFNLHKRCFYRMLLTGLYYSS